MQKTVLIAGIVGCVLGYGYWHAVTHAVFHVELNAGASTVGPQPSIADAHIRFLDAEGRVLANGKKDKEFGFVHLIHPDVGDCHEIERAATSSKEGRNAWQRCFNRLSVWTARWAGDVRKVEVETQACRWRDIPVTVRESNEGWMLWWVPHPHIGGKPYKYYSLSITLEGDSCERESRTRIGRAGSAG